MSALSFWLIAEIIYHYLEWLMKCRVGQKIQKNNDEQQKIQGRTLAIENLEEDAESEVVYIGSCASL